MVRAVRFSHQNSGETPAWIRALPNVPFGFHPEHPAPIPEDIDLPNAATAAQTRSEQSARDGAHTNIPFDSGTCVANNDDQANSGTDGARAAGPAVPHEGIGPSQDGNAHGLGGELNSGLPPPQGPDVYSHQALPKDGIASQNGKEGEDLFFGPKTH